MKSRQGVSKAPDKVKVRVRLPQKRHKYTKEERSLIAAEQKLAEQFLCERINFVGTTAYVEDGRNDLLLSFTWQDAVRLIRNYGIDRIVKFSEECEARRALVEDSRGAK